MSNQRRRLKQPGLSASTNAHLIGKPNSRERLATPALVLDLDAFEFNLSVMAEYCRRHITRLRPHAKSHKSIRIAQLQAEHGAVGICVATMREAATMVTAGVRGVLITSPMVGPAKLDAVADLLRLDGSVMLVVDSLAGAKALETVRALIRANMREALADLPDAELTELAHAADTMGSLIQKLLPDLDV